jgi:hypothetical protein
MGSRTNFQLKDFHGSIWLYSHSGGDSKQQDLANALIAAEPRWTDTSYGMRIVISRLIGEMWDYETGFGISTTERGEESYNPICVDFTNETVIEGTGYGREELTYTFREFIAKHGTA